jgi:hypothetical protein
MKYACRVLELLQAGRDPSPPQLPLVFYRNLDGERTVKVARSQLPENEIALRTGQIIKTVEGTPGGVTNPTQLIHALRGRLETVALTVEENGAERRISGRLSPTENILNRKGVFASGVLFAPRETMREVADIARPRSRCTMSRVVRPRRPRLGMDSGGGGWACRHPAELRRTRLRCADNRPVRLTLRRLIWPGGRCPASSDGWMSRACADRGQSESSLKFGRPHDCAAPLSISW